MRQAAEHHGGADDDVAAHRQQCRQRIRDLDPLVQAWQHVFDDTEQQSPIVAGSSARAISRGAQDLSDLVVGVKDIFNFRGYAPGNGAAFPTSPPAPDNAAIVQRLIDARAAVLGMTRLTEYCYYKPGPTRNPHHLAHTPGGSSSGSAAAVAAGMADVAIGTQTVGSTIRPASFCGVYGFKPTFGAISRYGLTAALSYTMDHVGILARRPVDLIRTFDVLRGEDLRDPSSFAMADRVPGGQRRLGVIPSPAGLAVSDAMAAGVEAAARAFARRGWEVQELRLPFALQEVKDLARTLLSAEAAQIMPARFAQPMLEGLSEDLQALIQDGLRLSANDYWKAMSRRFEIGRAVEAMLAPLNFMAMPPALGAAPKGLAFTGDPICTVMTSLTGLPALSIPFGADAEGLPLGVQIVGPRFSDRALLMAPLAAGMPDAPIVVPKRGAVPDAAGG